jgi:hypothetical protein
MRVIKLCKFATSIYSFDFVNGNINRNVQSLNFNNVTIIKII